MRRLFHVLDASGRFAAPAGELSVVFLDAAAMAHVHEQFLQLPGATDVITFPGDAAAGAAGEICVCPAVARDAAAQRRNNFAHELALYLAHAYLHLAGEDDTTAPRRKHMRRAEHRAMALLRAANAVPQFSFA